MSEWTYHKKRVVGPAAARGVSSESLAKPGQLLLPWVGFLAFMPALGAVVLVLYGLSSGGLKITSVGLMVGCAAFTGGGILGFLFAVPRGLSATGTESAAADEAGLKSNSNLEQISDWLTKILVGVGLVQIGAIARGGSRLVRSLAPALGGGSTGRAFAAGLLVFCTTTGFMIAYFVTRVFVGLVFSSTEAAMRFRSEADRDSQSPTDSSDSNGRFHSPLESD